MQIQGLIFCMLLCAVTMITGENSINSEGDSKSNSFTVIKFFHLSQMVCINPSDELIAKYDVATIKLMEEAVRKRDIADMDLQEAIKQVNQQIYRNVIGNDEEKHSQLYKALELILPDCIKSDDLIPARKELKLFVSQDQILGDELTYMLESGLKDGSLTTQRLAKMLQNMYYHWIPLGMLQNMFEKQ